MDRFGNAREWDQLCWTRVSRQSGMKVEDCIGGERCGGVGEVACGCRVDVDAAGCVGRHFEEEVRCER